MAIHVSRRHIASYVADQLMSGNKAVIKELAAYLVDERRVREWELMVRDIENALAQRGVVIADIASARELNDEARKGIKAFVAAKLDAKEVYLRETIDEELIGGIRMSTPDGEMDASVRRKLMTLRASKV